MQALAVPPMERFANAPTRLSAVVTDLDGVLCDTETVLVAAINRFLAEEGPGRSHARRSAFDDRPR